jgi:division protein CdvB (Snf7/Vps24/ESCRT-III family)
MDSVFDSAEAEDEEDDLVDKVFDEIGLEFSSSVNWLDVLYIQFNLSKFQAKNTPYKSSQKSSSKATVSDEEVNKFLAQYE